MVTKPNRSRGLGRGLSALMADVSPDGDTVDTPRRPDMNIPIERIHPNPDQPRRNFDEAALNDLAASVGEKGIIQPLILRRDPNNSEQYQIVAGERRWRAAQMAQLHEVPAVLREYSDTETLEIAIIENIQRSDLNAVDEAAGYRQLMDRFGHTQDQLASALGKSRSHIANSMRLLALPDDVQVLLINGALTAGQARPLIGHDRASELAKQIVAKKLSARQAEQLAKAPAATGTIPKGPKAKAVKDADTLQIEAELKAQLKMSVSIDQNPSGEGGKITIGYRDLEQLDDLLRALSGG